MARNRRRRRREEDAAENPPELGDALDAARDRGVEDVLDEQGPEGTTPAPESTKHGSAYIDHAKLAETGAEPIDAEDHVDPEDAWDAGADFERAPDELERDDSESPAGLPVAGAPTRKQRGRVLTFLGHCVDELRRVQWPNRRQVGQGTAVTLGFVVLAGSYLGLMDAIWKPLVEKII